MTTKELIRQKIDAYYAEYKAKFHQNGDSYHLGIIDGLDMAEQILGTLPDEPITTCNELEEAAEKYASGFPFDNEWQSIANNAFIAGAGWMAKQQPLPEDSVDFQKGVQEGKRLMMEGAVEGEVCILPGYVAYVKEKNNESLKQYLLDNFKAGDKVKVIIVKEDAK